jgi:hypothetical protein
VTGVRFVHGTAIAVMIFSPMKMLSDCRREICLRGIFFAATYSRLGDAGKTNTPIMSNTVFQEWTN